MRLISAFLGNSTSLADAAVPKNRLDRIGQAAHRRLADSIEESFQHACLLGDLETAADLIGVLEEQRDRWVAAHGSERRSSHPHLARMKEELMRRRRVRLSGQSDDRYLEGQGPTGEADQR